MQLVQRFEGHRAPIIAVDWRVVDGLVFQLVSLDEGGHLRLWRVDRWALRACGHASRSEGLVEEEAATVNTSGEGGGGQSSLSASLASKLTLNALKSEIRPLGYAVPSPAPRPSPPVSSHAASSVWQEMIEVEDMARRGELRDVEIEMIDSMSRTMQFSLGPIMLQFSSSSSSSSRAVAAGQDATSASDSQSLSPTNSPSLSPHSRAGTPKPPIGSTGLINQKEGLKLLVTVEFPADYPYAAMPKFSFRAVREEEDEDAGDDDAGEGEDEDDDEDSKGGHEGKRKLVSGQ